MNNLKKKKHMTIKFYYNAVSAVIKVYTDWEFKRRNAYLSWSGSGRSSEKRWHELRIFNLVTVLLKKLVTIVEPKTSYYGKSYYGKKVQRRLANLTLYVYVIPMYVDCLL